MKLIVCHECNDVRALRLEEPTTCNCGKVFGRYTDRVNAVVEGNLGKFSVIGFSNSTFINAIKQQLTLGDLPPTMWYGDNYVSPGRSFEAFIIPKSAKSVKYEQRTN